MLSFLSLQIFAKLFLSCSSLLNSSSASLNQHIKIVSFSGCLFCSCMLAKLASAPYAPWAHHHWVWLSNHVEDRGKELALVKGYLDRNVPGRVLIRILSNQG